MDARPRRDVEMVATRRTMGQPYREGTKLKGRYPDIRNKWLTSDGLVPNAAAPSEGTRISLVYFTNKYADRMTNQCREKLKGARFRLPELSGKTPQEVSGSRSRTPSPSQVEFASEAEWLSFGVDPPPKENLDTEMRPVAANTVLPDNKRFWRLFIADTGSPYDVIKRRNLLKSELQYLDDAPSSVELHGAGGVIKSGKVAKSELRMLNETIHPYALEECPDLLSVGYRCRRAGYTFEWPTYSDQPMMKTPDGANVEMVNIMDVPYFKEENSEHEATPEYHEHVWDMPELVGHSAIEDESENGDSENQQELAPYPLAATLNEFLRVARPNVPGRLETDAKRDARAAQG